MGTKHAVLRPVGMRFFSGIIILSVLFLAGCSAPSTVAPSGGSLPTGSGSAAAPLPAGLDPVQTGRQLLEASHELRWLEAPIPVVVQQMSYAEARKWVPMLSEEGEQVWGAQTGVWLVVFRGRWELTPIDPARANPQPATYKGCLLVLFTAADGRRIATGDTLCPGQQ